MEQKFAVDKDRIETLKGRAHRCCCRYCGGALEVRRIIFSDYEEARVEIFCVECDRIEYGTEPEIYLSAQYFVEALGFDHYPGLDHNDKTRKMNIVKVCDIMTWCVKHLGFLDQEGFKVAPVLEKNLLGEHLLLSKEALQTLLEEGIQ